MFLRLKCDQLFCVLVQSQFVKDYTKEFTNSACHTNSSVIIGVIFVTSFKNGHNQSFTPLISKAPTFKDKVK